MGSAVAAKSVSASFDTEKATKNTVRFAEQVPDEEVALIGTLYVPNTTLDALGNPKNIRVTIEAE